MFEITDNGKGIPANKINKIFDENYLMNACMFIHIVLHMGNPSPVPSQLPSHSSVSFSSNIFFILFAGMPLPLSVISNINYNILSSSSQPTCIPSIFIESSLPSTKPTYILILPFLVCLSALDIRLLMTLFNESCLTAIILGHFWCDSNISLFLPFLANNFCDR